MDAEIYISPELTVVETETQEVVCTSTANELLFENNGLW